MFFNCELYHSKIEKQTHFPRKIYKLSKTNTFFSCFEGRRGEKTKYFAPLFHKLSISLNYNSVPVQEWVMNYDGMSTVCAEILQEMVV